ncbi:hypothetical protein [Longimicrobium sp.]|uniref:hypothetical protein n=1 Tax=Longimicrobium sp. TaxID=2029185 RepID=UPI002E327A71|nr:hypothetical protein [Longimicrobium sp.]HEX6037894.1 hypothetical protein [Longimicrobium sp.]
MELLIVPNAEGTYADVLVAAEHTSVPAGGRSARVIGPGESYRDVPYPVWAGHVSRTVDLGSPTISFPIGEVAIRASSPAPAPTTAGEAAPAVKLRVGDVLDTAFQLIRRAPLLSLGIAMIPQLPSLLLADLVRAPTNSPTLWMGVLVAGVLHGLGQALLILVLAQAYHGIRPDPRRALATLARRSGVVLCASALTALAVLAGSILLLVPGVIVACLLFAVPAVAVLEKGGPAHALQRSWSLALGAGWSIFLVLGVLQVLDFLTDQGLKGIQGMGGSFSAVSAYANFTASVFLAVLSAAVVTSLYFSLRVAREGYDLELMTDRLGSAEPAPV